MDGADKRRIQLGRPLVMSMARAFRRNSSAARSVKVVRMTREGVVSPTAIRSANFSVRVYVFPEPAPALMNCMFLITAVLL